jgi:hypothetical protein
MRRSSLRAPAHFHDLIDPLPESIKPFVPQFGYVFGVERLSIFWIQPGLLAQFVRCDSIKLPMFLHRDCPVAV